MYLGCEGAANGSAATVVVAVVVAWVAMVSNDTQTEEGRRETDVQGTRDGEGEGRR